MIPAVATAHESLARGSKSFALAGRLLPPGVRDDAAVLYAWCRRADDAIDLVPPHEVDAALARLRRELDMVYGAGVPDEPLAAAFQQVVRRHGIPRQDPGELLEGFAMDAEGRRYDDLTDLRLYCFRVAGTVGLMMARIMGATAPAALARAADLGIAMQLTNICRDVNEDWQRGRLYLPRQLVGAAPDLGGPDVARAVEVLLAEAERNYRSGDRGLSALPFRCAIAIRTARLVYSEIGRVIARRRFAVRAGRAVVPGWRKRALAAWALLVEITGLPRRLRLG